MFPLPFPLGKISSAGNKLRRTLSRVFAMMYEAQIQRAQKEIDRYHRMSMFGRADWLSSRMTVQPDSEHQNVGDNAFRGAIQRPSYHVRQTL